MVDLGTLGTVISYIQETGNIWFVIAAVLFGVLLRELKDHKEYTNKVNEEMVGKDVYLKSLEHLDDLGERYKEIVSMINRLSEMLAKIADTDMRIQGEQGESIAKILTILSERLPRRND
jgi:hypothetical protein